MGYARTRLEEATERIKELERKFACFKCGDGNTPLYCLNCANDALKAKLEATERVCVEAKEALQELHDWQNGPPLVTYEKGWSRAMELTEKALARLSALVKEGKHANP